MKKMPSLIACRKKVYFAARDYGSPETTWNNFTCNHV